MPLLQFTIYRQRSLYTVAKENVALAINRSSCSDSVVAVVHFVTVAVVHAATLSIVAVVALQLWYVLLLFFHSIRSRHSNATTAQVVLFPKLAVFRPPEP